MGAVNICFLDYLMGTLSTAYTGMITSLVVKDFCITGNNRRISIRGDTISMPTGWYQTCLLHQKKSWPGKRSAGGISN